MEERFGSGNNADSLLDYYISHTIEAVVNVGFLSVIVIVGIIGNVINVIIFVKQDLRDRINACLFSLALADLGYLLALFIYKSFSLLTIISKPLGAFWKVRSLNTILGVFWGFSTVSNLLTLLVSLERCLCVVSPLRAKEWLKTKVMAFIIVLIYLLVLSSSLIFNVKFTVGLTQDQDSNTTTYQAVLSEFYLRNKLFVDIVYNYVLAIALPFASLVVVIISTIITVVFLKRALAWKQTAAKMAAMDKKEAAVTKMLLIVCYVYVLCVTPSVVNAFVVQFVTGWIPTGRYSNTFYVYVSLMHLLTALNSSLNFFIYYLRGTKFRRTFRQLCCGRQRKSQGLENSTGFTTDIHVNQPLPRAEVTTTK